MAVRVSRAPTKFNSVAQTAGDHNSCWLQARKVKRACPHVDFEALRVCGSQIADEIELDGIEVHNGLR